MTTIKTYAKVNWTVEDVLSIRPHWTAERAEEELIANEKYIRERLTEVGWNVLEALLPEAKEAEAYFEAEDDE